MTEVFISSTFSSIPNIFRPFLALGCWSLPLRFLFRLLSFLFQVFSQFELSSMTINIFSCLELFFFSFYSTDCILKGFTLMSHSHWTHRLPKDLQHIIKFEVLILCFSSFHFSGPSVVWLLGFSGGILFIVFLCWHLSIRHLVYGNSRF